MSEQTNPTPALASTAIDPSTPAVLRTADVIASEIIGIKEAARKTLQTIATSAAVEIGKRLKEAKALVPYGAWGEWLRVNVDYSERTAQNLLRLAEESAKGSFGSLMELNYTQAVQLIGLPVVERAELLEQNDVAELSTRELQELVDKYRRESTDRQQTIDSLLGEEGAVAVAESAKEQAEGRAGDDRKARERAERDAKAAQEKADRAAREAADAKKKAETAEKQAQRLEDELKAFRDRQTEIKEPQALAEVAATVVQVIPPEVQDELEALREKERQRQANDAAAAEALKREGAEYTFRILYDQFTGQFKKLTEAIGQMSPENQNKYAEALRKAMDKMAELLPGVQEGDQDA
jgi:hypothetical protein